MAVQGPVIIWVADHRRHHAFSDREGDPHSPWLFGTSVAALARGSGTHTWAGSSIGTCPTSSVSRRTCWRTRTSSGRTSTSGVWTIVSLVGPAVIGGLITMSWAGALTAFFWAGLVRVALLHHVTWWVNSICHMIGERPFSARDRSANFWPLALLSFGESWHNLHHADPTSARHGVLRGQLDISARVIWFLERFGRAIKVRWPSAQQRARIRGTAGEMGH